MIDLRGRFCVVGLDVDTYIRLAEEAQNAVDTIFGHM